MPHPYPHLMPAEAIVWVRFLQRHAAEWDRFEYDARVGEGHPVDSSWPPEIQEMARHLGRKRIDAIGWQGSSPTLFEVTPYGKRTTYGALLLYEKLYRRTFSWDGPLALAAVCSRIDPDVLAVMQEDGITVYLMPAPLGE